METKYLKSLYVLVLGFSLIVFNSCKKEVNTVIENTSKLEETLLLHASFDKSTTADFAKGDPVLYDTPSPKALDSVSSSLQYATTVSLAPSKGIKGGGALEFKDNLDAVVFYKAQNNVNFQPGNWQGTISFWLKLNPDKDLKVMYSDPIQITESDYQNATIWIDFPNTNTSRILRLGVLGDMDYWSSEDKQLREAAFFHRLRSIENPPFNENKWTHVAITHNKLGSGQGSATLYIDGEPRITHDAIKDPFTWEHKNSRIYLGFSYTGLIDELKIFSEPLDKNDIERLSSQN
jgi:hypothetical protein